MANIYVDLLLDDSPIYEYSVSLEGNSYIIEMIYNERMPPVEVRAPAVGAHVERVRKRPVADVLPDDVDRLAE